MAFLDAMGETYGEMRAAFEQYLADDCVWTNQGLRTVQGKAKILESLQVFADRTGLESVNDEVLKIASVGETVLTERHEQWTGQGGDVLLESLPVMGVFEVADGKIKEWRDYFDTANIERLTATDSTA